MGHWIVEIIGIPKYDITHSIFMRTEPELAYEPFGQINRPAVSRKQMYHYIREAKILLSKYVL